MADPIVARLRSISNLAPTVLGNRNITNDKEFWKYLGDGRSGQLTTLANELQVTNQRVLEILSAEVLRKCERRGRWSGLGANLAFAAIALVVIALVLVGRHYSTALYARQVVVTSPDGLAAFHVIQQSDVALSRSVRKPKSFAKVEDIIGSYSLSRVSHGTVLTKELVGSNLCRCQVVSIPAAAGQLPLSTQFPAEVTLLFPAKDSGGKAVKIEDVYLLGSTTVGDKTVLQAAVPMDKVELIPAGEVYLFWPIR